MNELLFPTFGIDSSIVESITAIYDKIKPNMPAEFDLDYTFNFMNFELFNNYNIGQVGPVICINKNARPFYLTFTEVVYKLNSGNRYSNPTYTEFQTWGIISLRNNYGHVLIKPETLLDKIHDLINPIELDFKDDKDFSKKFYVITNDKLNTELQITSLFRDHIQHIQVNDFMIEIIDDKLIIGNKKVIEPATALAFMQFLYNLSRNF